MIYFGYTNSSETMELLKILNFAKAMHILAYRRYQYVKVFVNTLKIKRGWTALVQPLLIFIVHIHAA